ncbi:MAG TPA: response regulator [Helicobacteraceae bacterium]|nr:response regulator [Helicobacteraceae bacterium]
MSTYTILAVDDEPFNLDLIEATFLGSENCNISYAKNGQEALEILETTAIDVVLLDISMPGMDGLEVLQILRNNPKHQQLPVIMVTANSEKKNEALTLGASDFISKPYDIEELKLRTLNYAKFKQMSDAIASQNEQLERQVQARTKELNSALALSKATEYEISARLGKASEFRDLETGGHIKRMSHYSAHLAKLFGLDEAECSLVLYAAPLHDIGKVGIPDQILLKPGRHTHEEFEIMKHHAILGAKMLEDAEQYPVIEAGRIIALEHHEKYDGTGYPLQKKGDAIHLYARIVTIADVFDALSSKRVYKPAMDLEKTLSIMKEGRGQHFDPILLDLFLNNLSDFQEIQKQFPDEENVHSILDLIEDIR